jgi:predicted PurR-regulated permease PerM
MSEGEPSNLQTFARRTLIVIGIVLGLVLLLYGLYKVTTILIVIFAGVLLSVLLDGVASWIHEHTPVPRWLALTAVVIGGAGIAFAFSWFAGPPFADQMSQLADKLDSAVVSVKHYLEQYSWGRKLISETSSPSKMLPFGSHLLTEIGFIFSTTMSALGAALMILFVGIYLAADPHLYIDSIIRLVPPSRRARAYEVVHSLGTALRWWLVGRFITMFLIAILTTAGLYLIGLPLAPILGLIGGLFTFVPYLGPIAAAAPAVLVGFSVRPMLALWVVIVYLAVHGLEGYVISPLIQEEAVSIPPALLLSVQIIMASIFGIFGILFATPITVVVIVLFQTLYVRGALGDNKIRLMGEHVRRK